ncbi:MAG: NADH-quinone oxidoreductase subunit J [Nitrospirae bacterium]|jgi:NADH-quinone oxidoreductase subunit J|nr:NADH-quinone oxidoreductase subunit J [Nitrospirota bacterium]
MILELFFAYFAFAIIVLSIVVITRRNPVHSVLWMLLLFFHIASVYLFLNAEFMAAVQLIVYAGGIMVLFLFVVLLVHIKEEIKISKFIGAWSAGFTFAAALFVVVALSLRSFVVAPPGKYTIELIQQETHTKALGKLLYTEFLFPFEIAALILTVAIVGALVLAKRRLKS